MRNLVLTIAFGLAAGLCVAVAFACGHAVGRLEERARRRRESEKLAQAVRWAEQWLRSAAERSDFGMNPQQPYDVMVYVDAYAHLRWTVEEYLKKAKERR
jgi:hypothetical protein